MLSLTSRLLIALSVVLTLFLGLTGYTLDKAFQESARAAAKDRLQGHVMTLIAGSELKLDGSIYVPNILPIVHFNQPNSGLYGQIVDSKKTILWKSASLAHANLPVVAELKPTEIKFEQADSSIDEPLFSYSFGVSWDITNKVHLYTVTVAENLETYQKQTKLYREKLWGWLGALAILLLAVQGSILRWSLSPLRKAANEIEHIESGEQLALKSKYPDELRVLTRNINALISSNQTRLNRYRHSLSDLAHSLKTPLALMQSAKQANDTTMPLEQVVNEQVAHMKQIIDYQLQRAATSGQSPLSKPINVETILNKIHDSLQKVYHDKGVNCELKIDKNSQFHGDESDLFELIGNLMDNAFKWCHSTIKITIISCQSREHEDTLFIAVEDDGPGIDEKLATRVMERGIRSDEKGGSGIGLAIVNDIVNAYQGSLEIQASALGGAAFNVTLSA